MLPSRMMDELETKTVTGKLPRFEVRPLSEEEGGGYLLEFYDYPGCIADGDTPIQAIREGFDALRSYRATLNELGHKFPVPGENRNVARAVSANC